MFNAIEDGGLRMTNLNAYIMAQKSSWIKRLIETKEMVPYKYLSQFLPCMDMADFFKCSIKPQDLPDMIPEFYRQVLYAWFDLKEEPVSVSDVQREVIWFNRCMKINNEYIFHQKLYKAGLVFINDLLDVNGSILPKLGFENKFSVEIPYFFYMSLVDAIPTRWRTMINKNQVIPLNPKAEAIYVSLNKTMKPVTLVKSKEIYWHQNNKQKCSPKCIEKWNLYYNLNFSDTEWKTIFCLPHTITCDTKLREFQFKIVHRTYATDSYVSNFDKSVNPICAICNHRNNIIHLFVDCKKTMSVWQGFKTWYKNILSYDIVLSVKDIIFGVLKKNIPSSLNFCILHVKWFIHCCRKIQAPIIFENFLHYIKNVLKVEKWRCVRNVRIADFEKSFGDIALNLKL